jgi:uncharacterized protein YqeY
MLIDEMRRRMAEAFKAGRVVEKNILRLAVGEAQTLEARGVALTDDSVGALVRKIIKSNEETIALGGSEADKALLREENAVLQTLLPKTLDVAGIVQLLEPSVAAIRAAGNDGQATGVAMKALKEAGAVVNGKDVTAAVKQMRV